MVICEPCTTVGIAAQSKLANYDKSAVLTHRCDALWSDSKEFVGGEVDGGITGASRWLLT